MAIPYPGNAIPAPAHVTGTSSVDDELLYSTTGYVQKGVTLKPGQGVLTLGTALKQDASTKQYVRATTGATTQGILRKTVDTGVTTDAQVWLANILYGGVLKLSAISTANSGFDVATIVGAQVNAVAGFFRF